MNELPNNYLQALQAIKVIPEDNGAARQNQLVAARLELLNFLEVNFPEKVSEVTALQEIVPDTNVSNETIDSYIRIVESIE